MKIRLTMRCLLATAVAVAAFGTMMAGPSGHLATAGEAPAEATIEAVAGIDLTDCDPTCADGNEPSSKSDLFVDEARRLLIVKHAENPDLGTQGFSLVDLDTLEQTAYVGVPVPDNFDFLMYEPASGRLLYGTTGEKFACGAQAARIPPAAKAAQVTEAQAERFRHCLTERELLAVSIADPTDTVLSELPDLSESGHPLEAFAGAAYDPVSRKLFVAENRSIVTPKEPWAPVVQAGQVVIHELTNVAPEADGWDLEYEGTAHTMPPACASVWKHKQPDSVGVVPGGERVFVVCAPGETDQVHEAFVLPYWRARAPGIAMLDLEDDGPGGASFAPFPGGLAKAQSAIDHENSLVALTVGGGGRGQVYVFDAAVGSWIGSVPTAGGSNVPAAPVTFDPSTRRLYVQRIDLSIEIIEAGVVPAEPKKAFSVGHAVHAYAGVFDPGTRRLFIYGQLVQFPAGTPRDIVVYHDGVPPFEGSPVDDPDADTHDIDEADAVSVDGSGTVQAFGARILFAGGTGSTQADYFVGNDSWPPELKPASGDRAFVMGQTPEARLDFSSFGSNTAAEAVGLEFPSSEKEDPTEQDLRNWYGQILAGFGFDDPDDPDDDLDPSKCDYGAPSDQEDAEERRHCLAYDAWKANVGEFAPVVCASDGASADTAASDGAAVECGGQSVSTAATSSGDMAGMPIRVGYADSSTQTWLDPGLGVVTKVTAVARGIEVSMPGLGTLSIGEVRQEAMTRAKGTPGSAESQFAWSADDVRITNTVGTVVFSCGVPSDDQPDTVPCDPQMLIDAIHTAFGYAIAVDGPRRDPDLCIREEGCGARAMVRKDIYARVSDKSILGDDRPEVVGLQLSVINDLEKASRVVLQLSGVYAESQYYIGAPKPDLAPGALDISLLDEAGEPLAGGLFGIRPVTEDGGAVLGSSAALAGACVTGGDGVGDCVFEDLAPGPYEVTQTAAPAGYAPASPYRTEVVPGNVAHINVTNVRAIGEVVVELVDDRAEEPLAGAEFMLSVVTADGGVSELAQCVTDATGGCGFADVPLGDYRVAEVAPPTGYQSAAPVDFTLAEPGQIATVRFANGLESVAGTEGGPAGASTVSFLGPDRPVPTTNYSDLPDSSSGTAKRMLGGLGNAVGDLASLITRKPGQAALLGMAWMLLISPLYLAARRRSLNVLKELA